MEPNQARGYILEFEVKRLLEESGYVDVKSERIRGRGANHQIDSYGILSIPTAFIYPIRLISEAKFHSDSIGLPTIRNFVGVIKDISENYFVKSHERSSLRFTDVGCIFSASSFTIDAQEYAWAHNIFLVSFSMIELMQQLLTTINESVDSDQMVKILKDPNKKRRKKERIIESYKKFLKNKEIVYPTLVVGILDNVYPVVLVGNNGWIKRVVPPRDTDKLDSRKDDRIDNVISGTSQEHIFEIIINEELVFFNLPHFAATKILKRIEKNKDKIAEIQIPFKYSNGTSSVRRIISLNVKMQI